MSECPTTTLPGGEELPRLGFGTWRLEGQTATAAVDVALENGYRHVDTAEGYGNEAAVGAAIADSDLDREDVFLTSKVLPKHLDYESLIAACETSLERLGVDALDLYLIHWPNPAVSIRETLDAMATLHDRGLVANVGVSNFTAYQLSVALHVSDVPIAVNQIEFHPWYQQPDVIEYCHERDVVVEAAAPFGRTEVFADDVVQDLAETYGKTPPQIVLRWALQRDVVPLPRSGTATHVRENAECLGWELDPADVERLNERDRGHAVYDTGARDWSDEVWGIAA
jgi:diketogulonate reductase-like aldo/keto reductase